MKSIEPKFRLALSGKFLVKDYKKKENNLTCNYLIQLTVRASLLFIYLITVERSVWRGWKKEYVS